MRNNKDIGEANFLSNLEEIFDSDIPPEKKRAKSKESLKEFVKSLNAEELTEYIDKVKRGFKDPNILTESAANFINSIMKLGDKYISVPKFYLSILSKYRYPDDVLWLQKSQVLDEFFSTKTNEEFDNLLTKLKEESEHYAEEFDSITDDPAEQLCRIMDFGVVVTSPLGSFMGYLIDRLRAVISEEDFLVSLRCMDLILNYHASEEDLFFISLTFIQTTHNDADFPEQLKKTAEILGDFGLLDMELNKKWSDEFIAKLIKRASEPGPNPNSTQQPFMVTKTPPDDIKKTKSMEKTKTKSPVKAKGEKKPKTSPTPSNNRNSYKNITISENEFVQAGKDGSRSVVSKSPLDVPVEEDKETKYNTPFLDRFGEDLCKKALEGKIDPLIGRDKEIRALTEILSNRKKSSAVLIGKAGCGKTAIVEYLATLIVNKKVPTKLVGTRLISLPMSSIQAGAGMRGELEGRLLNILNEVKNSKQKIILYMDEIHQLGQGFDGSQISDILKPDIASGKVTIIGSTTEKEYRRYIERDQALVRRFSRIIVEEPTIAETIDILKKSMENYSNVHRVQYPDDVIEFAVRTSSRYLRDNARPDLPFGVLDRAGSSCELNHESIYKRLDNRKKKLQKALSKLQKKKADVVFDSSFDPTVNMDQTDALDMEISNIQSKIDVLQDPKKSDKSVWPKVTIREVAEVISNAANIPIDVILEPEIDKLAKLEETISQYVIGQEAAVKTIAKALCSSYLGLRDPNKPIASFMFIGPTGVGKTELAKKVAELVFGTEEAFLRIDGGEYSQSFNDSKLLGAAPGYVGFNTTPSVFDKIRRRPYTLLLVDEVEKIHPDIVNKVFLSILDEGVVTLSDQTKVDMRNCVIVFTGNVGSTVINNTPFNLTTLTDEKREEIKKEGYKDALRDRFRPEFLGRLTEVVCFNSLNKDKMKEILELEIVKFKEKTGRTLTMTDELKDYILNKVDYDLGVRNLSLVIKEEITDKMSEAILKDKKLYKKVAVTADYKDNKVIVNFK